MIFTDRIGHLISDQSIQELHFFASKLGLKRQWFQDKRNGDMYYPHYDLTTENMRFRARGAGAVLIDPRDLVQILFEAPYNNATHERMMNEA